MSSNSDVNASNTQHNVPAPKTELDAARCLLAAQAEYLDASKKHVALLDEGIKRRDMLVGLAGNGYPRSWKDTSLIVPERQERESTQQLAAVAGRVAAAQAAYDAFKKA